MCVCAVCSGSVGPGGKDVVKLLYKWGQTITRGGERSRRENKTEWSPGALVPDRQERTKTETPTPEEICKTPTDTKILVVTRILNMCLCVKVVLAPVSCASRQERTRKAVVRASRARRRRGCRQASV